MSESIEKILVPIDGSEGSLRGATFAGRLARATGAEVTLLMVQDPDAYIIAGLGEEGTMTQEEYEQIYGEKLREQVAKPAFQKAKAALDALSRPVREELIWGHPAEAIVDYAHREGYDMIVMGSRGRSTFAELLLGSVSHQVVHHAPCPVTIVR